MVAGAKVEADKKVELCIERLCEKGETATAGGKKEEEEEEEEEEVFMWKHLGSEGVKENQYAWNIELHLLS